jgi:hypothetical protein
MTCLLDAPQWTRLALATVEPASPNDPGPLDAMAIPLPLVNRRPGYG